MRGLLQLLAAHLIGGRGDAGITRGEVWLEALKIVNARRDYYGRLFWQLPTITVSATILFLGAVSDKAAGPPWWALALSGLFLTCIARVAHSIKKGQDSLERDIARIDREITALLGDGVSSKFPMGNKWGSRLAVVTLIYLAAAGLLLGGLWEWDILRNFLTGA
jgi:hypothetical protein